MAGDDAESVQPADLRSPPAIQYLGLDGLPLPPPFSQRIDRLAVRVTQLTAIVALAVLAWPAAAQLFLMAASVATVLPEADRAALGRRLAVLAHDLVAGNAGRMH